MAVEKSVILLFEDDESIAKSLRKAMNRQLDSKFAFEVFPLTQKPRTETGTYEDRLIKELQSRPDLGRIVLIVTDRDLSSASDFWRGLSEAAVSRAAKDHGIPVACYRLAKLDPEDRLRRVAGDGLIELPKDEAERAHKIAVLARGFQELQTLIQAVNAPPKKGGRKKVQSDLSPSPGALLASILKQPIVASRLDTFACRDETAIAEILRASGPNKNFTQEVKKRLVVALGVWLADLVMVYPGVLLNETAAASYLDIERSDFKRKDVRKVFDSAMYRNLPFADDQAPMWWRHLLDDIVSEAECETGLEVCRKKKLKRVRFCPCSIDKNLHAGFYCMATFEPLSAENSSGRVKWFPQGADLARLTKSMYLKLGPWIGS